MKLLLYILLWFFISLRDSKQNIDNQDDDVEMMANGKGSTQPRQQHNNFGMIFNF